MNERSQPAQLSTDPKTQIGRIAFRVEGDRWVAYYAQRYSVDQKSRDLAEYFLGADREESVYRDLAQQIQDCVEDFCSALESAEVAAQEEGLDREPPEPDGECFRGGEYESALGESQARIQRELKR